MMMMNGFTPYVDRSSVAAFAAGTLGAALGAADYVPIVPVALGYVHRGRYVTKRGTLRFSQILLDCAIVAVGVGLGTGYRVSVEQQQAEETP
jgi:hypothetical protein